MISFISDLIYDGKLSVNLTRILSVPRYKEEEFTTKPIEIIDTSKFIDPQKRMETEVNSTFYNLSEAMISVNKVMDLLKEEKG